jgi:transposase-like protein
MEGGSISRRKSYTAQFKLEVVEVAKEKGNRETGRLFNVGESSVWEWRKAETVLKSLHKRKRAKRFRRCLWPTIEKKKLYDWVVNERAKGMRISAVHMLQESKRIAQENNIKDFKAYPSWVFRFMKRNNLSVRFSTNVGQKLPSDWEAKVAKFRLYLRENLCEAVTGDSDYVHDDTFSEMEAEEIRKEILNAIDSFTAESDEEFLGFE